MMMQIMMQIVYSEPEWGYLVFAVVAIFLLYLNLATYRKKVAKQFGTSENIQKVSSLRSKRFFWFRVLCLGQASLFGIFALMQPIELGRLESETEAQSEKEGAPVERVPIDELVFIIDVSASMACQDAKEYESRIERAKEIAEAVVEHLGGISITLYAFAGNADNIVPATMDYLYFRIFLSDLQINETGVPGTNFSALIDEMKKKYLESKIEKRVRFILFTDGEDTGLVDLAEGARLQEEKTVAQRLKEFSERQYYWDVIGMGGEKPAVIPNISQNGKAVFSTMQPDFLRMLAERGGGHLYFDNALSLSRIVDGLLANVERPPREQNNALNEAPNVPFLKYPLLAATLFLALALVLPERRRKP